MNSFIKNILVILFIGLAISSCSAPKPAKISFVGNMKPINFDNNTTGSGEVIKSSKIQTRTKTQNYSNKQFVYSINEYQEYSPEFFYSIAHADKIIAHIKPPFIDYVFSKVQSQLRGYGVTTRLELFIEKEGDQNPQVILECIKFDRK